MIRAIVIPKKPAWFCKRCHEASLILYSDDNGNKWFDCCVPEEVKKEAKYFNQIGEEIKMEE